MQEREQAGMPLFRFHFSFMKHKGLTMDIRSRCCWRANETFKRRLASARAKAEALKRSRQEWLKQWNSRLRQWQVERDRARGTLNLNDMTFFDLP